MRCHSCSAEIADDSRYCSKCGSSASLDEIETRVEHRGEPFSTGPSGGGGLSFGSGPGLSFAAGDIFNRRYRIVGRLGRGGMGEVYRADDLELEQPVALKFLSSEFSNDLHGVTRFRSEVRLARQVSHPNVCRVHDIGEVDGTHFLSMEYVDGEDLRTLLRRIGRLTPDKALQISRQLCAGLAAAHTQGVVHRDLKPANIMLDGEWNVRITDFGLAVPGGLEEGDEVRAGTPNYMAPEQFAGRAATIRSDIFSLGLILLEIFSGRPLYRARTLAELTQLHTQTRARAEERLSELDPRIEEVVLRCLDLDAAARPASALVVSHALPGGDPLKIALEAGETPSPQAVADAGRTGTLSSGPAVCLLLLALASLGFVTWLGSFSLVGVAPLGRSPEVLADQALQIYQDFGYRDAIGDRAWGFFYNLGYLDHIDREDSTVDRWQRLSSGEPSAIQFWYRQSREQLVSRGGLRVTPQDPPPTAPGMVTIRLATSGKLIEFVQVPSEPPGPAAGVPPDWRVAFEKAGLDFNQFTRTRVSYPPPVYSDVSESWSGVYPNDPDVKIEVVAGAYDGHIVYFRIEEPWSDPIPDSLTMPSEAVRIAIVIGTVLLVAVLVGSVLVARRNILRGRGDLKGALRVAGYVLSLNLIGSFLLADHALVISGEVQLLILAGSLSVLLAVVVGLLYVALEPYLRRRWPEGIIAWSRLLAGRFSDPLVGRDLLVGATLGAVIGSLGRIDVWIYGLIQMPSPWPTIVDLTPLEGPSDYIGSAIAYQGLAVGAGLAFFFLLMLVRFLVRRDWLAILIIVSVGVIQNLLLLPGFDRGQIVAALIVAMIWSLVAWLILRYGVLAGIAGVYVNLLVQAFPLTPDLLAWHSGTTLFALSICLLILGYGFTAAIGKRV